MKALPIFICGPARSGTTLLTRLLDSHPDLAVLPEETYLYHDLLLRRNLSWLVVQLAELADLPRLPGILARRPFRWFAFAGRDRLRSRLETWIQPFDNTGRTPADVVNEVALDVSGDRYWEVFLDLYDRLVPGSLDASRYWLEKTPSNERFIALHERVFSNTCRYVHIIRDPRDVVASWLKQRRETAAERARTLIRVCYLWSLSVHLCARGLSDYPGRYCAIRYEDLVCRPLEVMHTICRFLEIDFDERVLSPTRLGKAVPPNSSYAVKEPASGVFPSQIGRFSEVLRQVEVLYVQDLLRQQMAACGYGPGLAIARDGVTGSPPLPPAASRSWKSGTQLARMKALQRKFAGRSLSFGGVVKQTAVGLDAHSGGPIRRL